MSHVEKPSGAVARFTFTVIFSLLSGCAARVKTGLPLTVATQNSRYLYAVSFEGTQDVFSRNAIGDAIIITAVHGTAANFSIGNTYRIDGVYTLASHEQAEVSAFMTDTGPDQPSQQMIPGQSLKIVKGTGTFTLFLKIENAGYPHVSFYPVNGGESFAGEYFGTGNFAPAKSWRVAPQVAAR